MKAGVVLVVALLLLALFYPIGWIVWDSLEHGVQL